MVCMPHNTKNPIATGIQWCSRPSRSSSSPVHSEEGKLLAFLNRDSIDLIAAMHKFIPEPINHSGRKQIQQARAMTLRLVSYPL